MFLWQITRPANSLIKGGLRAIFFFSCQAEVEYCNTGIYESQAVLRGYLTVYSSDFSRGLKEL